LLATAGRCTEVPVASHWAMPSVRKGKAGTKNWVIHRRWGGAATAGRNSAVFGQRRRVPACG